MGEYVCCQGSGRVGLGSGLGVENDDLMFRL